MPFQQFIANTLLTAAFALLMGVSFAVIYRPVRFFHISHGAVFVAAPYCAYLCHAWLDISLLISILVGVTIAAALGFAMEISVYRPLRRKDSSTLILLLASLGLYVILQNCISIVFGDDMRTITSHVTWEVLTIFDARVTEIQVIIIGASILLTVAYSVLIKTTRIGLALRAVADNPELATIIGVSNDRVIAWAFIIGSALAGITGVIISLDVNMTPIMGMNALLIGIVAFIIGGTGKPLGIALGALLLATGQHLAVWVLGSQWQDATAFLLLILFLLLKPEGFIGKRSGVLATVGA